MPIQYRVDVRSEQVELIAPQAEIDAFKNWIETVGNLAHTHTGAGAAGQGWPGNAPQWATEIFNIRAWSYRPY